MRYVLILPKAIVGLGAVVVSLPFLIAAMFCVLAGEENSANRLMDRNPFTLWLDYVERK